MLNGSGLLSRAPGTRFGDDTASAIGQGQQRLNRDHISAVGRRSLKIDGLIKPDGPTQTATLGLARQVADQWRGFEQRRKPALPTPSAPNPGLPNPQRPSVTPAVETPFTADIKRQQDALTADQAGELTRLADGLSKTRKPGAIAGDISEAINTDGLKALAEFQVVRDRLAKIGTPDQVRALDEAVLGGVSEEQRDQLKTLFLPHNADNPGSERERNGASLSAGTDDGDGTGRDKDGSGSDISIRMPEGQEDLSISIGADAADEDKADALIDIANALKTQKAGEDDSSDELIKDVGESVLSLVPGVGNVLSARDAYYAFQAAAKAYEKGDLSEAGIQAALGVVDAVGAIPGPGNLVKGAKEIVSLMTKGGKRLLKKNTPAPSPNSMLDLPPPGKKPEQDKRKTLSLKKSDHAPQSLSNEDARYFYNERVKIAQQRNAKIRDIKKGAEDGHQIRNKERSLAREKMADRKAAAELKSKHPNLTMEDLLQNAKDKGLVGGAAYKYIRKKAFKTNQVVNRKFQKK